MEKKDLMGAVRELREKLGITQSDLARDLGRGMSTIQRWEQVVPPRGKALADLYALALNKGQHTLASMFHLALAEEMGSAASSQMHRFTDIENSLAILLNNLQYGSESANEKVQRAILVIAEVLKIIEPMNPFSISPREESE